MIGQRGVQSIAKDVLGPNDRDEKHKRGDDTDKNALHRGVVWYDTDAGKECLQVITTSWKVRSQSVKWRSRV